ncbi:hypothetical protein SKAU_G00429400 [Synaphobranchus kaupii]|uniref:Uncharacterized protein n=1 Tax=Synaphobranchus kaupii TaxID=118154 RepID=A0A9Q1E4V0_SYNKA|nr:hypothetical protein SKAU_G00429400 [Synaphobranchus kaupii]
MQSRRSSERALVPSIPLHHWFLCDVVTERSWLCARAPLTLARHGPHRVCHPLCSPQTSAHFLPAARLKRAASALLISGKTSDFSMITRLTANGAGLTCMRPDSEPRAPVPPSDAALPACHIHLMAASVRHTQTARLLNSAERTSSSPSPSHWQGVTAPPALPWRWDGKRGTQRDTRAAY